MRGDFAAQSEAEGALTSLYDSSSCFAVSTRATLTSSLCYPEAIWVEEEANSPNMQSMRLLKPFIAPGATKGWALYACLTAPAASTMFHKKDCFITSINDALEEHLEKVTIKRRLKNWNLW